MSGQPCPNCREPRIGAFRYCRTCGFDFDSVDLAPTAEGTTDDPFVPFDLFPARPGNGHPKRPHEEPWSREALLTGIVVIGGILGLFIALLVLRPLG